MPKRKGSNGRGARSPANKARQPTALAPVLERNIEALAARRKREAKAASWTERLADVIRSFAGSMTFLGLHLLIVSVSILANLRWIPGVPAWDETFVILAMIASVEALFLSSIVLISQNRMASDADRRADLDLQISVLTEHEITKLTTLVSDIARKMDVRSGVDQEVEEIKRDVAPEQVLQELEKKRH